MPNTHPQPAVHLTSVRSRLWASAGASLLLLLLVSCTSIPQALTADTLPEDSGQQDAPVDAQQQPTEETEETGDTEQAGEAEEPGESGETASDPDAAPTPISTPDFADVLSIPTFAGNTPEETIERYIDDAVAQQVSIQREKVDMRVRYQNPAILNEDLGGLIVNIELIQDRSLRTILRENSSTYEIEIDVRVTYADGDTSTLTCAWTENLSKSGELWYVTAPRELLLFVNCA